MLFRSMAVASVGAVVMPARPGIDGELMLYLCQAVLTELVLLTGLSLAWRLIPESQPEPSAGALGEPANRQRVPPTCRARRWDMRLACGFRV